MSDEMLCYAAHHFCKITKLVELSFPVPYVFNGGFQTSLRSQNTIYKKQNQHAKYFPKHLLSTGKVVLIQGFINTHPIIH